MDTLPQVPDVPDSAQADQHRRPHPRDDRSRVTVTGVVYHHVRGAQPTAAEHRHSYWCDGGLPAFSNSQAPCGPAWAHVELGWFCREPVGLVLLRCNDPLAGRTTIPSDDDRRLAAVHVLEVCLWSEERGREPDLVLRPGEEARLPSPARPTLLLVRCPAGPSTYSVTAFPR